MYALSAYLRQRTGPYEIKGTGGVYRVDPHVGRLVSVDQDRRRRYRALLARGAADGFWCARSGGVRIDSAAETTSRPRHVGAHVRTRYPQLCDAVVADFVGRTVDRLGAGRCAKQHRPAFYHSDRAFLYSRRPDQFPQGRRARGWFCRCHGSDPAERRCH